jgi:hypothetical protein
MNKNIALIVGLIWLAACEADPYSNRAAFFPEPPEEKPVENKYWIETAGDSSVVFEGKTAHIFVTPHGPRNSVLTVKDQPEWVKVDRNSFPIHLTVQPPSGSSGSDYDSNAYKIYNLEFTLTDADEDTFSISQKFLLVVKYAYVPGQPNPGGDGDNGGSSGNHP